MNKVLCPICEIKKWDNKHHKRLYHLLKEEHKTRKYLVVFVVVLSLIRGPITSALCVSFYFLGREVEKIFMKVKQYEPKEETKNE